MATPYIGSKISLISQLDIRYEGTLHSVDPVKSTISLSQVRSFGTEDREVKVQVPSRKEVYDFIIFKASDIKDLIVCDAGKQLPGIDDITYDPAIISVSKPQSHDPCGTQSFPKSSIGECGAAIPESEASSPPANEQKSIASSDHYHQSIDTSEGRFGQNMRRAYYPQRNMAPPHHQNHMHQQKRGSYFYGNDHQRPCHNNYYLNQSRGSYAMPAYKFERDFDFEKANEQFRESVDEIAENLVKANLKPTSSKENPLHTEGGIGTSEKSETNKVDGKNAVKNENYYDKSRSFFDNISCEALERESGKDNRVDWKKERMTNEITFGTSAVRMYNYQRRGTRGASHHNYRRDGHFFYNNQQQRHFGSGVPGIGGAGNDSTVVRQQTTK